MSGSLFAIENGQSKTIQSSVAEQQQTCRIVPLSKNKWLCVSLEKGIYVKDSDKMTPLNPSIQKLFDNDAIYSCAYSKNGELIMGTVSNGIYLFLMKEKSFNT